MVKICVVGCLHGELDRVYTDIAAAEQVGQFKTDLVLCCGDFQSLRNPGDLVGMSVPAKYYAMGDFWRLEFVFGTVCASRLCPDPLLV
ncbi:hypothetical protein EG68_01636 [Paragonimus skrjabini miyazakii]|uniref:Calcineurin-like phosphoesterase domain-containing protein n=1 Tax=Paragonimus skrjabini miyazakii TaxID=59628 RepID=A0A8S9Z695_9TREM|nr:hypothetical protein EG68_01636 [Paragonimus skrjabini miyazakii]